MDASKSSKAETSSTAPVEMAGATFFTGDSDAQEKQEASADDHPFEEEMHYSLTMMLELVVELLLVLFSPTMRTLLLLLLHSPNHLHQLVP